jgi:uncharacterized repeat protein (TIGR03806 family)
MPRRTVWLLFPLLASCANDATSSPGLDPVAAVAHALGGGLRAEYFDEANLTASKLVRIDPAINFDWKQGSPAPGVGPDTFSVRWTGQVQPRFSETYTFFTVADDGVRVFVDGKQVIDDWNPHAAQEHSGQITLAAGQRYSLTVEYFDAAFDASVRLEWASPSQPREVIPSDRLSADVGVRAEYYDDAALRVLKVTRREANVDFDWGLGSPDPSIAVDTFSARFTGRLHVPSSATYTFFTVSDDGVRLWVDGQPIIDNWTDHAPTENQGSLFLDAATTHTLRLEYYEAAFGAQLHLSWSSASFAKTVLPPDALSPPPESSGPFGVAQRPSNATCRAPERPQGADKVQLVPALGGATFSMPVGAFQAPQDGSRWFVVEKAGTVKVIPSGGTPSTFVDVRSLVNAGPQEAGLLGMAFHPRFATNGQVFLSYTAPSATSPVNLRSVVARFTSKDGGKTLEPTPEELLSLDQPFENHNGGNIAFGPDGRLYLGLGDGGSAGDPNNNAQNTQSLLGKLLRIGVDGSKPYAIPADNPFALGGGRKEIYALGFRNPWRYSFDRATGELWLADVGQSSWEEIDRVVKGGNYGWKPKEGDHCFGSNPCNQPGLIDPVWEYDHSQGVSITGGFVYRGSALPPLIGQYLYGDFGSGRIWALAPDAQNALFSRLLLETGLAIASFAEGADGELYVIDFSGGKLYQLAPAPQQTGTFPTTLSATGCFDAAHPGQVAPGVLPYDVNSPLWSDGAVKERFMALPDGARIHVEADGDFTFPVGTVLIKSFSLGGKRVETRLLVRHTDGAWGGYTYEWNAAQTDAALLDADKTVQLPGGQSWTFPSRAQCVQCHTAAAGGSLGPEIAQLNRDLAYPGGLTANQLATLDHIGLFDGALDLLPSELPQLSRPSDPSRPLEPRAKAYLHANCSFCHRPLGTGRGPADFRAATPLSNMGVCDAAPTVGDLGVANARLLAPGASARSIISVRMHALDDRRMPPVGRALVDSDGTAVVDGWITRSPAARRRSRPSALKAGRFRPVGRRSACAAAGGGEAEATAELAVRCAHGCRGSVPAEEPQHPRLWARPAGGARRRPPGARGGAPRRGRKMRLRRPRSGAGASRAPAPGWAPSQRAGAAGSARVPGRPGPQALSPPGRGAARTPSPRPKATARPPGCPRPSPRAGAPPRARSVGGRGRTRACAKAGWRAPASGRPGERAGTGPARSARRARAATAEQAPGLRPPRTAAPRASRRRWPRSRRRRGPAPER